MPDSSPSERTTRHACARRLVRRSRDLVVSGPRVSTIRNGTEPAIGEWPCSPRRAAERTRRRALRWPREPLGNRRQRSPARAWGGTPRSASGPLPGREFCKTASGPTARAARARRPARWRDRETCGRALLAGAPRKRSPGVRDVDAAWSALARCSPPRADLAALDELKRPALRSVGMLHEGRCGRRSRALVEQSAAVTRPLVHGVRRIDGDRAARGDHRLQNRHRAKSVLWFAPRLRDAQVRSTAQAGRERASGGRREALPAARGIPGLARRRFPGR